MPRSGSRLGGCHGVAGTLRVLTWGDFASSRCKLLIGRLRRASAGQRRLSTIACAPLTSSPRSGPEHRQDAGDTDGGDGAREVRSCRAQVVLAARIFGDVVEVE